MLAAEPPLLLHTSEKLVVVVLESVGGTLAGSSQQTGQQLAGQSEV